MTAFLKKVILVLEATAPHLLTVNKSVKVEDEGKKLLAWPLESN